MHALATATARQGRGPLLFAALLTTGIFLIDTQLPFGANIGLLYVLVVLLGYPIGRPGFPVMAAGAATALTVLDGLVSPPGGLVWFGLLNKAVTITVCWTTALLISSRQRAGLALEDRTRRAQEYLDIAGVMMVALDADGRVAMINRKGLQILGRREAEMLGGDWFDLAIPAAVRDETRAVFGQLMRGLVEPAGRHENAVITAAGEERLIAWHNTILRDADGRITGTLSSGEDVSAQKAAEAALQRSLKDLADVKYALDQAAIVAATDTRGRITFVNDKFCEISKYSAAELLGQDHRIINSGYHSKEFIRTLWVTIANGRIWRGEIRNRAKDGSIYWVDTTIVPFLDEAGRPYQYMAIRSDITEKKRAEERLREQTTLARLGEMAAVVAHEVRNPLAGIRGALQVIGSRMPADSRDRTVIADILNRLDSLNDIVDDLLLFARPRVPKSAPVSIASLIEATTVLVRKDPAFQAIALEVRTDDRTIQADAEQLQTVLLNLLLNAAQAIGGKGRIELRSGAADGAYAIRVRDDGPGVPAEIRERVFEPFVTTKHRGTGLGLPIAKRVVEMHGGHITIDCPPGGGTEVTVTLPIA
jgi:two-component system CheB/CheR fusion protein